MVTDATSSMLDETLVEKIIRFKAGLTPEQKTSFHIIEAMLVKQVIFDVLNDN